MKGHIRQRGKHSWAVKLDIGRDPVTGKRRTRWHTVRGTKRDAQRELNRLLHELDTGAYVEPNKLTVTEFLRRWLKDVRPNVRPKTFERYNEIVEHHLIPAFGQRSLAKLQPVDIAAAWSHALDAGRCDGKGGLSAQTVKHHHRVLSQALSRAVRWQLLTRNPAAVVDPPRPQRKEMKILSPAETGQLLTALEHTRLYVPVLIAVTTGLRRGEFLALRWRNVDLDAGSLSVVQMLEQTRDGLRFQAPKTARSRRTITLPSLTVDVLRRHKVKQAKELLRLGIRHGEDALVVCAPDGQPCDPNNFSREFQRLLAGTDLPRIRLHDLRHSHISHLLLNGVHPKVASERAGHASVSITLDTYSHVLPGLQEDAAAGIDSMLRTALEQ